ncbi:hypothetical protein CTM70_20040, partial [Photobacterium phosphoreum]|uniref:hypothetical protein n=1 Tax=Photobacterium phosphoreum TaxID=659 RepID=UPI000D1638AB
LKLHHNEMRDCPEEMLLALYRYTKGYHKIVELIGSQIEPETHCVFQFDYVQRGSVELKNKIGYKPSVTNFIGYCITKLLSNNTTDENLEDIAIQLEKETASFIKKNQTKDEDNLIIKREPFIDRITLAEIAADFSDGGELLHKSEYFEVYEGYNNTAKNIIKFNPHYRSKISITELKKSKPEPYNGMDTIIALRPCNVGNGAWYVYSVITKRSFYAKISHIDWLSRYQSGKMEVVRANDLISVNLVCDIIKTKNGNFRNVNAIISSVHSIERGKFLVE